MVVGVIKTETECGNLARTRVGVYEDKIYVSQRILLEKKDVANNPDLSPRVIFEYNKYALTEIEIVFFESTFQKINYIVRELSNSK